MKKVFLLFSLFVLVIFQGGCKKDVIDSNLIEPNALDVALGKALLDASDGIGSDFYKFPTNLSDIPQDPNNPLTAAKVELGRLLYHETGLATNPKKEEGRFTYSCASCHHAPAGFQAGLPQGIADGGLGFGLRGEARYPNPNYTIAELDVQPIRTPSSLNIAYQPNVLWNGQFGATHLNIGTEYSWDINSPKYWNFLGYEGTEIQAIAGLEVHRQEMTQSLFESTEYQDLYYTAFGEVGDDTLRSNVYSGLALAAYQRTILATEAPFQQYLNGDKGALSPQEKEGAVLFFSKGECYKCHNGPALANMEFHALGMNMLDGPGTYFTNFENQTVNLGRGGFTENEEDMYQFKVPQLYNLINSKFYGHGATFHSVEAVIRYKNDAIPENTEVPLERLADDFHPLNLSTEEIAAIATFIEYGLYDRNLERYVPENIPSGFCFPNNDYRSGEELGCQ
ncbi:cytochrome-c peroxidase [Flavobacteriales bacterium]|nr:cytochrome-c peroxidase [Flavobacteriales bacterium]